MAHDSIESIDLKLQQLKNRRAQLLARQSVAERKRSTRQAIIVGKWLMARKPEIVEAISKALERDQDRAAFGLPPKMEKAPVAERATRVDILLPLDGNPAPSSTADLQQK
jgi:hypothetical protein